MLEKTPAWIVRMRERKELEAKRMIEEMRSQFEHEQLMARARRLHEPPIVRIVAE